MISRCSTPDESFYRVQFIDHSSPWSGSFLHHSSLEKKLNAPSPTSEASPRSIASRRALRAWRRKVLGAISALIVVGIYLFTATARNLFQNQFDTLTAPSGTQNLTGLKFIDASHPFLRFVGRWTSAANGKTKEGCFPGAYFEFQLINTSTLLLTLQNSETKQIAVLPETTRDKVSRSESLLSTNSTSGKPISLWVKVDDDEYVVFPDAASTVAIRKGDLDPTVRHSVRVIAPMLQHDGIEILQINGIYLDEGAQIISTSEPNRLPANEENIQSIGASMKQDVQGKMLEIVTDLPGAVAGKHGRSDSNVSHDLLRGVMGWDYLLGEMFGADHASVGMDRMCLVRDCIGGKGSPVGIADLFFRSGPLGSKHYTIPWTFQEYIPDVMVLNVGNADWESFQTYSQEYNKSIWDLSVAFEDTYVSLVKGIRAKYSPRTTDGSVYGSPLTQSASGMPIFLMRPLRGQLEGPTYAVVDRLRKDGDKAVFWLDTSGWLNTEIDFEGGADDQDFFLDEEGDSKEWRLTERGNRRVAILLHLHVCHYLAKDPENCAFLPPEIYQGNAQDPNAVRFDEYIENEREQKLKRLFWESGAV